MMDGAMPTPQTPRIVFGEIGHRRLAPRLHAFVARAFYLQLPLVSLSKYQNQAGQIRAGNWVWGLNRPALLQVMDRDHGDGGPCLAWARQQLKAAGLDDLVDGEIWLSCLPRMLGYTFKPVSFWFCENRQGQTLAIIAEVNNTFGDRHVYLLDCRSGGSQFGYRSGQTLVCQKAFYVSPFFPVSGEYQFRFRRGELGQRDLARIEYRDPEPVLLTHMSGMVRRLDHFSGLRAALSQPLFSLGVILQIHWHALVLWLKKVPLVARPAP